MALTHEQKADVGVRFLANLNTRIATRATAKAAADQARAHTAKGRDAAIKKGAEEWVKFRNLEGEKAMDVTEDSYYFEDRLQALRITTNKGQYYPRTDQFPALAVFDKQLKQANKLRQDLCEEIEFLSGLRNHVAGFQAHVGRLWAPESKAVMIGDTPLKKHIEDYITSKRSVVCKVGG